MSSTRYIKQGLVHFFLCVSFFSATVFSEIAAQSTAKSCTVKDGKMYIIVGKQLSEASLDSFIDKYDLYDLALKQHIKGMYPDTLKKLGWRTEVDNSSILVVSKPIASFGDMRNPADKLIFTEKQRSFSEMFPVVSSQVSFGFNRFRNKNSFLRADSIVRFFLRGSMDARKVMLAGNFNDWSPDNLAMRKTDSGWIADVKLKPGKYWYKFVVDDNWMVDKDNSLSENDGLGNVNSVFYRTNTVFKLNGYSNAKRVYLAGSFNNWEPRELLLNKTPSGWELQLYLADGTHTYRYVVDGNWMADPGNPNKLPNEFNEFNSVVRIGKPYLFQLDGSTGARQVILSGSFNNWRTDELYMTKTAKGWELPYTLGPGNYEYNFIVDGKRARDAANRNFYFIIEPNHVFRLKGFANAKSVFLAGDFNGWSPNTYLMKKEGNEWVFNTHLSDGKHLYKFVVDGKWIIDPDNKLWEQNEHGTGNSVIWIGN